ncbi:cytochrome P450 71B34-like [Momordica charantia]|uniref:Cytochrome P450 71B34-like n=1 Tax=Momordica charantia TaxID=3673 RepID=A0A6J1DFW6_MOMCH|nr:cytochrome P450 71B34-like [Momordica charantia]
MVSLDQRMMQYLQSLSLSIWDFVSLLLLLSSSLILFNTIIMKLVATHKKKKQPPPGPPKLPLLGHLHLPHRSLRDLSAKYGPVMLLKLGSVPTMVVSSAAAARDLFKLHDLASCSRPRLAASGRFSYNFLDLNLSPYGERWRELRKICMVELFSARRVQSFEKIREEEVGVLINSISQSAAWGSSPIDVNEKSYSLTASITTRVAFGKTFRGGELDDENFQQVIRRAVAALGSFSASDFFPGVGWIVDRVSGVHGRLEKSFAELDEFFQRVVDDRVNFRETRRNHEENIVDVLLKMERDCSQSDTLKFTTDCIKALIMDIFLAGVETGAGIIVWAMAELVRNPRVMKKLQHEIRSSIKGDQVKESELEKLEYLKMVVKEVLRLHPPATLLLPRETMSHFELNGYDIDPKAHLHVNVWAIGRDPEWWINPEEFSPERFIGSNVDYRGQNFELLPFGAGRRICPGMNMGTLTVELALANMLLCFDWKLAQGMKEEDVDMEEDAGLTTAKKSLLKLVPHPP